MRILKKVIKKLYHLIWFLSVFFIFSPLVNAETLDFNSTDIRSFTYCRYDNSCVYDTQLDITSLNNANHLYYGTNTLNESHRLYQINIKRSHFDGVNDGDTVSFYMYDNRSRFMLCGLYAPDSNYIQQNSNSFLPLVTLNNYYCDVHIYGMNGETSNNCSYERRFFVTCPYYHNTAYDFDYIQSYYNNGNTSAGGNSFFGITTMYISRSVEQTIQDIQNGVNNVDDTINNSSVDSSDSTIDNLKTQISTNNVISNLLLLPVRFLQNFVNALGSSCSRFSLGSLYGTELFMPCINIQSYLGSGIWTTIDLIISGLFIYSLRKKFIQIYENLTNLTNGGNEVD